MGSAHLSNSGEGTLGINEIFIGGLFVAFIAFLMYHDRNLKLMRELRQVAEAWERDCRHWKREAAKGYEERASRGDIESMVSLADIHRNGALARGDAAKFAAMQDTNYKKSFDWYYKAADSGSATAMFWIGYMFHKGITPDLKEDRVAAAHWYNKAIEAGDERDAREWLGLLEQGV